MRTRHIGFIALGIALIAGVAHATDYPFTWTRPFLISRTGAPPNLAARGENATEMAYYSLGSCTGPNCPHAGESGVVGVAVAKNSAGGVISGWNYVTCIANYVQAEDTNHYGMLFEAGTANWPTVWPATLVCSAAEGGNSVSTTVPVGAAIDPDWFGDPLTTITIAGGVTITMHASGTTKMMSTVTRKNLPAGSYYSTTIPAKKSGSLWDGVTCKVIEKGATDVIVYTIGENAAAGTGSCKLQMSNGTFQTTPVTVVRQ